MQIRLMQVYPFPLQTTYGYLRYHSALTTTSILIASVVNRSILAGFRIYARGSVNGQLLGCALGWT